MVLVLVLLSFALVRFVCSCFDIDCVVLLVCLTVQPLAYIAMQIQITTSCCHQPAIHGMCVSEPKAGVFQAEEENRVSDTSMWKT